MFNRSRQDDGGSRPAPAPLYSRVMGPAWDLLDEAVRRVHAQGAPARAVGDFRVRHGTGTLARLLRTILHLPPAAEAVATTLQITPLGTGERWARTFGRATFVTTQAARRGEILAERIGALELRFRLRAEGGALAYRQVGAAVRLGPLAIPLPGWLAPRVEAREEAEGPGRTHVAVSVSVPLAGPVIAYDGRIRPEASG